MSEHECTMFVMGPRDESAKWDVRDLVKNVKLDTDSDYSAGTLTFDLLEVNEGFVPHDGDDVQFTWDNEKVFYGHVFKVDYTGEEVFSCTAYDNRRYLKNQDSRKWPIGTLSQRFDTACSYVGVNHAVVDSSSYKLPAKLSDGTSFWDMLKEDIEATKRMTGEQFFISDAYGRIELHKFPVKDLGIMIGDKDGQIVTSWSYDRSIDDAANIIKVVKSSQKDKQTVTTTAKGKAGQKGKAPKQTKAQKAATKKQKAADKAKKKSDKAASDKRTAELKKVYGDTGAQDPENTVISSAVAKADTVEDWGGLQVVVKEDNDKANQAQMQQLADSTLKQKNVETKEMKISTLGSLDFVVGVTFVMQIQSLADIGITNRKVTVTKVTQNFDLTNWTTDMEVTI